MFFLRFAQLVAFVVVRLHDLLAGVMFMPNARKAANSRNIC